MRTLCTLAVAAALATLAGCADGPTAATDPETPTLRFDTGPGSGNHVPGDSTTVITTSGGGTVVAPGEEGEEGEGDTEEGGGGLGSGN